MMDSSSSRMICRTFSAVSGTGLNVSSCDVHVFGPQAPPPMLLEIWQPLTMQPGLEQLQTCNAASRKQKARTWRAVMVCLQALHPLRFRRPTVAGTYALFGIWSGSTGIEPVTSMRRFSNQSSGNVRLAPTILAGALTPHGTGAYHITPALQSLCVNMVRARIVSLTLSDLSTGSLGDTNTSTPTTNLRPSACSAVFSGCGIWLISWSTCFSIPWSKSSSNAPFWSSYCLLVRY